MPLTGPAEQINSAEELLARTSTSERSAPSQAADYHVAGILIRSGRQLKLRLADDWPWTDALIAAFARLQHRPVRC